MKNSAKQLITGQEEGNGLSGLAHDWNKRVLVVDDEPGNFGKLRRHIGSQKEERPPSSVDKNNESPPERD